MAQAWATTMAAVERGAVLSVERCRHLAAFEPNE